MAVETDHEQTLISHGELEAEVDAELAEMILALWQLGVTTEYSCQGGRGPEDKSYILFATPEDATRFAHALELPFDREMDSLSNRALQRHLPNYDEDEEEAWRWTLEERWDWEISPWSEYHFAGRPDPPAGTPFAGRLRVTVRFPYKDLAEVSERIKRAVDRTER